jgi:hypothetical protein
MIDPFIEQRLRGHVAEIVAMTYRVRPQDICWTNEQVTPLQYTTGNITVRCPHGYTKTPLEMQSVVTLLVTHKAESNLAGLTRKVLTGQCPDCGRVIVAFGTPQERNQLP